MFPRADYAEVPYRLQFLFSALLIAALTASTGTLAADIQVFTDRHHTVSAPAGVRVIELDAPARIETALATNLPADPIQATAIVKQRLTEGGAELQRRLADAYHGVTDAWRLGVSKIPAVVVDQRFIVYGEPDVARALARIAAYRRTTP